MVTTNDRNSMSPASSGAASELVDGCLARLVGGPKSEALVWAHMNPEQLDDGAARALEPNEIVQVISVISPFNHLYSLCLLDGQLVEIFTLDLERVG